MSLVTGSPESSDSRFNFVRARAALHSPATSLIGQRAHLELTQRRVKLGNLLLQRLLDLAQHAHIELAQCTIALVNMVLVQRLELVLLALHLAVDAQNLLVLVQKLVHAPLDLLPLLLE